MVLRGNRSGDAVFERRFSRGNGHKARRIQRGHGHEDRQAGKRASAWCRWACVWADGWVHGAGVVGQAGMRACWRAGKQAGRRASRLLDLGPSTAKKVYGHQLRAWMWQHCRVDICKQMGLSRYDAKIIGMRYLHHSLLTVSWLGVSSQI